MNTYIKKLMCVLTVMLAACLSSHAQKSALVLDQNSFRPINSDAVTGLSIDPIGKDRSNRPCARLKLKVGRMTAEDIRNLQVRIPGGNVIVMKREVAAEGNGLIIELTARPATRFYLHHDDFGDSAVATVDLEADKEYYMEAWCEQEYTITVSARSGAEVYMDGTYKGVMNESGVLNVRDVRVGPHSLSVRHGGENVEKQIDVSADNVFFSVDLKGAAHYQQFVVFSVTPEDAYVELDGEPLAVNGGVAQKLVRYGTHSYLVEAADYHSQRGEIVVDGSTGKKSVSVSLTPAFGQIDISGESVKGAYVYVDRQRIGTAPVRTGRLSAGSHQVRIVKDMYVSHEATVEVAEGEVVFLSPVLLPDFAELTLVSEEGADIWIDGEFRGKGRWSGRLPSGLHAVECRKEGYSSMTQSVEVDVNMAGELIVLDSMTPLYGILMLSADPSIADVYIDGVHVGQTPLYLSEVLVGNHDVKVMHKGYKDWTAQVSISEGQVSELNCTLVKSAVSGSPVMLSDKGSSGVLPKVQIPDDSQGKFGSNSEECVKYLSYYSEYYKQKNYDEAYPYWKKAYELCPHNSRYSLLSDGTALMRRQIQSAVSESEKADFLESLMLLYAERIEFWPKYGVASMNNLALDAYNYMKEDKERLLQILDYVVENNGSQTRASVIAYRMSVAIDLYNQGRLSSDECIRIYETGMECLNSAVVKSDVDRRVVEENKDNLKKLYQSSGIAEGSGSSVSGRSSGNASGKSDSSESYAEIIKTIGNTVQDYIPREPVKALKYLKEQLAAHPECSADIYPLMGMAWLCVQCSDPVKQWAVLWVADDYLRKAGPEVVSHMPDLLNEIKSRYPDVAEAFMYDLTEGQTYRLVHEGLTETTTVKLAK